MVLTTTILVEPETREKLKALGQKGDTYNSIIERLLETSNRREVHTHETKSKL